MRSASTCRPRRSTSPTRRSSSRRATATRREVFRTGGGAEDLAGYSRAVRAGPLVAVSGTAPTIRGGVKEQTLDAFRIALAGVEHFGGSVEDVVRTRIFLAAGCDWRGAAEAHRELFGEVAPANTTLFVAGFIPEGVLVEVELDAAIYTTAGSGTSSPRANRSSESADR